MSIRRSNKEETKLVKEVFRAVKKENVELFERLNQDSNFSWINIIQKSSGDSVLHCAAQSGLEQIIRWLLSHGCASCLELQNADGKRPLHVAAQNSNHQGLLLFLKYGAEVDPLKRADWTPLMLACTKQNLQVIQSLVDAGADLALKNKDGWTSFHIACRKGNEIIVNYFLEKNPDAWNSVSNNGRTPLHTAAMHGNFAVVKTLLQKSAYIIDSPDSCGNTPLLEALRMGFLETAEFLIDAGGSPMCRDKRGLTGFHIAAEAGQVKVLQYLMEKHGTNVNLKSDTGLTVLHTSAREGHLAIINFLVDSGIHLDSQDNNGRTALWLACTSRHEECVRKLLSFGASNIPDNRGVSPSKLMPLLFT